MMLIEALGTPVLARRYSTIWSISLSRLWERGGGVCAVAKAATNSQNKAKRQLSKNRIETSTMPG
jgi:hypothetical protein